MSRHYIDISPHMEEIAQEKGCEVDELYIDHSLIKHDDTLVLDVVEARTR